MTAEDVRNKIKERGYWEINFFPTNFNPKYITDRSKIKEIVKGSSIELRGWDYPHVPRNDDDKQSIYYGQDYVESYIDWDIHKQAWRFWQSGQFVHYLGLWEDWWDESTWGRPQGTEYKAGDVLSITSVVYTLSEIFEFLKRLAHEGIYQDGVTINLKLNNILERRLVLLDPGRIPLWNNYTSKINNFVLPELSLSHEQVLEESQDLAVKTASEIFETFNWEKSSQPIEVFKTDQEKLLQRRI